MIGIACFLLGPVTGYGTNQSNIESNMHIARNTNVLQFALKQNLYGITWDATETLSPEHRYTH